MNKYVYPQIFENKSDDEILRICKKYLGECDVDHKYFPSALVNGDAQFALGDRLWTLSHPTNGMSPPLDAAERRDLGVTGSEGAPLKTLACAALEEEAEKIIEMGIRADSNWEVVDPDEIVRRVVIVHDLCPPEFLNEFVQNSLSWWIYVQPLTEIEESFKNDKSKLANYLSYQLPPFFKMVEIFLEQNIDLEKVRMKNNLSVLDVYNILREKYDKYIKDGEIIEPQEEEKEEEIQEEIQPDEQKDDISQMMEDITDKDLSLEEIQRMYEENNKAIAELMAKNNELMKQIMKGMEKENTNQQKEIISGLSSIK